MYPDDIDPEDMAHYENIAVGGLLRKVTPPHIEKKFIERGYVRKAVGGLVLTDRYKKILLKGGK